MPRLRLNARVRGPGGAEGLAASERLRGSDHAMRGQEATQHDQNHLRVESLFRLRPTSCSIALECFQSRPREEALGHNEKAFRVCLVSGVLAAEVWEAGPVAGARIANPQLTRTKLVRAALIRSTRRSKAVF